MKNTLHEFIKPATSIRPQVISSATTINGDAVENTNREHGECLSVIRTGTLVGTLTIDAKVQESTLVGGPWADVTGAVHTQLTEASDDQDEGGSLNFYSRKAFLRQVVTTAGTVTSVPICGTLDLRGGKEFPVTPTTANKFRIN